MKNKITKLFIVLMLSGFAANAQQSDEDVYLVTKDYDMEKLKALEEHFQREYEEGYVIAVEIAKERGLPIEGVDENGRSFSLQGVAEDGTNLKYYITSNNSSTKSSIQTARVQFLHDGTNEFGSDIQGQGMILGIWDNGAVYAGHQSIGVARVTTKDGSTSIGDHASHVAGTMIANNNIPNIKGMAPQALLWSNNWNNDIAEMTAQASQGLLVSNHSYGADYVAYGLHTDPAPFGRYGADARDLDRLLYTADKYLPVIAAGNARNGDSKGGQMYYFNTSKGGADLMHGDAVSKNAVVVAAVEGITAYQQPSDVIMSNFSQWGPTDDFRIKPDISAKGVSVRSVSTELNAQGQLDPTATVSQQGTSMAAPSVAGVFGLWQQYYKKLYPVNGSMRAATVKALMAISADEAGTTEGPDHRFGWGLINARRGAEVLRDSKASKAIVSELELTAASPIYEIDVDVDGSMPLKAAIAWTDPEGSIISGLDTNTPVLVNDLDLRIIRPNNQEVLPWGINRVWNNMFVGKMDNIVDPIEVVEYKGAATGTASSGTYKIRVSHKGVLKNGSQKFSLIIYGMEKAASTKKQSFDELSVYPNPVTNILNISADLVSIADANVEIFDITGKQVYKNANLFYNTNSATIDLSLLKTGVYIVKLESETTVQSIRIVKK